MSAVFSDVAEHEMNLYFGSNADDKDDWESQRKDNQDGYGFGFSEYQKPSRQKSRQHSKKDRRSKWGD